MLYLIFPALINLVTEILYFFISFTHFSQSWSLASDNHQSVLCIYDFLDYICEIIQNVIFILLYWFPRQFPFGTPLQYSCLENPMDGGAWWTAVHGVTKCWTRPSNFTFTFYLHALEKEMATHSSVLAWRIPGMGEPGGLPSMGFPPSIWLGNRIIWMLKIVWPVALISFFISWPIERKSLW